MRVKSGLTMFVFVVMMLASNVYAQYAGGSGTQEDPYLIETPTHLNNVRNNLEAYFKQTANINLDVEPYNAGSGWLPIGASGEPFGGSYNGDGYTISNLMINRGELDNVGLFGMSSEAIIENLAVVNASVVGGRWTGVLAGDFSSTTVDAGKIISCYTSGAVRGIDRVGGLAGFVIRSSVLNCRSDATTTGTNPTEIALGGLVGFISTSGTISNSFATGSVAPTTDDGTHIGGLVGRAQSAVITNCYSIGRVSGVTNIGGLIGLQSGATTTASYWNTETSQQTTSQGGDGRTTEQMTYPYHQQTYVDWDFDEIWEADVNSNINNGYPYLRSQPGLSSPNPSIALNPTPADDSVGVAIDIDRVAWKYVAHSVFANPVGFRVYLNDTGQFTEEDDFVWVPYSEEEENYFSEEVLPDVIEYGKTYYWKVVPTTIDPENRGDAENVPVWKFTIEKSVNPRIASNPSPENEATEVPLELPQVSWSYVSNEGYADPVGFRLYMSTTEDFDDDFIWVPFLPEEENYGSSEILPEDLYLDTTYYWKVVPTTNNPENRGDAENVPVWSFSTIGVDPDPVRAINPSPAHRETGVSTKLAFVSWEYEPDEAHANPVGFRVYMNTTGQFGGGAEFVWVPYVEGQIPYTCHEIVHGTLDEETEHYWRVVPTTNEPTRKSIDYERLDYRGDAQGVSTWRFRTGETNVEESIEISLTTELIGNYPNPFNPNTTIRFSLNEQSSVKIEVYDIKGRLIATLINNTLEIGKHYVVWNGKNDNGKEAGSGVYFCKMTSVGKINGLYIKTQKMILMK